MKRRLLFWILLIAFLWVLVTRFVEVKKLIATLATGQWQWIAAAILLQTIFYLVFTALYQSAFDTVDVRARLLHLLPLTFAAIFVNVVAPSGGASGAALFMDDSAQRGESPSRTAAGNLLQVITDYLGFAIVLVFGLIYLFFVRDLQVYEIVAAVILLLMTAGMTSVLLMGLWRPVLLRRLLGWLRELMNAILRRFKRPPALQESWVEENAGEFIAAAAAVVAHPARLIRTIGISLFSHFINIASLYAVFRAFHQNLGLGVLVAGYAVGVLFWIVSITPQGIGVVEGVMALVYTSLGIPASVATVASLAWRGLSFWLPLLIGFLVLRRTTTFSHQSQDISERWSVRIMAVLAALMGLVNVLSALMPGLVSRIELIRPDLPLYVQHGGRLTATLSGFALLMLASGLWRGKRNAWLLTLIVLVISAASHLVKGLDYEEAALSTALAVWLFTQRTHFHALSDAPSIRQGLRVLAGSVLFTLLYGAAGFYLLDRHFHRSFGLFDALKQTVIMLTQFYDPGLAPTTRFGRYFIGSIYTIGAVTFGYSLWMLLRPVLFRQFGSQTERERARHIIEHYGRSSLARAALFPDKAFYFSPGGSVIAYITIGRTAVTLGDPIGPPEDLAAAVAGFQSLCKHNDWLPTFYQTLPETLPAYLQAGFNSLVIGEEAIVDLQTFTLTGNANKPVRTACNRLTRTNHSARVYEPPIPAEVLAELRVISDEWLTMMAGSEQRFSLGWFDDAYIRASPVAAVLDERGCIMAFANLVPEYAQPEVAVDLMRRRDRVEPGTMEYLFVTMFDWARAHGYQTFNLGLSSLAGTGEQPDSPAAERALHYIYEHVNQFYNFKGLHAFKEKFHPNWSPRYLVYPGAANLPASVVGVIRANTGEEAFPLGYIKGLRR